ncbi:hypothetical protein B484DRAFT_74589 [Ochromonadaceae sp. CCMP2298]|nr:hypothetical protein B484DRAFT_74589 [Ochromonadaceae sp. CCMP2298]|mmetsp:Transcript_23234/g.51587  ORF Transcript_23234/g.51587 Transcript_23234/m.51587 type:complete len:147 (+) Transcript_23234:50-490(+)
MSAVVCSCDGCQEIGSFKCSSCKRARYCSVAHQKKHWKIHKGECTSSSGAREQQPVGKERTETSHPSKPATEPSGDESAPSADLGTEDKRTCRCMFCGEELVLTSEDAAVDHMRVCSALQEQLSSPDQFTVPSAVRERMKKEQQDS